MLWFFWVWRRTTDMIQQSPPDLHSNTCVRFFFERKKTKQIANVHRLVYTTVGFINDEFNMNSEPAQFSRESSAFHEFHFFSSIDIMFILFLVLGLIIWMYFTVRQFCRWVWIKTFPLFFHGVVVWRILYIQPLHRRRSPYSRPKKKYLHFYMRSNFNEYKSNEDIHFLLFV